MTDPVFDATSDEDLPDEPEQDLPMPEPDEPTMATGWFELLNAVYTMQGEQGATALLSLMSDCTDDETLVVDIYKTKKGTTTTRRYNPMGDAREWHEAAGVKKFDELDDEGKRELIELRRKLGREEVEEADVELWKFCVGQGSLALLAQELSDQLVIIFGTADLMGINLPAVHQLVHDKNMTKINPETGKPYVVREDGKVGKPDDFVKLTEGDIYDVIDSYS